MLTSAYNALDYRLRQFFRWRRRGLRFKNESKEQLFAHLPDVARPLAQKTADRLLTDYRLHFFYRDSSADNYRENLFYLELLEAALARTSAVLPDPLRAADIGPSHWFYVQALHALLTRWQAPEGRAVTLTGFEADPYRVYFNFYSRYDHALAHLRGLPGARYVPERFASQPGAFDFITLLFPFVFARDHLRWGLPRPLFAPEHLLAEAWASLAPNGWLVIVNQGEAEHAAQREMLRAAGIKPAAAFCHESLLYRYDLLRYVLVARR